MNPYDGGQVGAWLREDVEASYAEAGQGADFGAASWTAEMQYDAVTMGYPASRRKHRAELRSALGLPADVAPTPTVNPRIVKANFCNLMDYRGVPIFSSCLSAQIPFVRQDWIAREKAHGGTHYVMSIETGYASMPQYGPIINFYASNRMAEWLGALDEVLAAGLMPVVFLSSGDRYPGSDYLRRVLRSIPPSYYPKCIWVCGWECVKGGWTSAEYQKGNEAIRDVLGADALMACHLSPGRLSFSSNPVEDDDPWQGDEMACWKWGANIFQVFLYQTEPFMPHDSFDTTVKDSRAQRAKEVADRVLGGRPPAPDWFAGLPRPSLIAFETVAYHYIRGEVTSDYAREVAAFFASLGYQGFGNGLPR